MLEDILQKRRSYRSLSPVSLSDNDITRLATAASLMPSCFNNQPWRFVFVRSPHMLNKLVTTCSKGNEWTHHASFIIAVVTRPEDDCQLQGKEYASFDTGMAVGAMLLMATEMDLVLHPIAGFDTLKAKEILSIPQDTILITLIIGGKKNKEFVPELSPHQQEAEITRPPRKSLSEFTFLDRWGNSFYSIS